MARVIALVPDLLFGSRVQGDLTSAGHEVVLAGTPAAAIAALERGEAEGLVVDLTADAAQRVQALGRPAVPVLAFYSHVDVEVRELGRAAGFALVVPRSRMAREGPALLARLLSGAPQPGVE